MAPLCQTHLVGNEQTIGGQALCLLCLFLSLLFGISNFSFGTQPLLEPFLSLKLK